MKIAFIGWGYLIWDRRSLDVAPEWKADGPLLPVEYARFALPPRLLSVLVERELRWRSLATTGSRGG